MDYFMKHLMEYAPNIIGSILGAIAAILKNIHETKCEKEWIGVVSYANPFTKKLAYILKKGNKYKYYKNGWRVPASWVLTKKV